MNLKKLFILSLVILIGTNIIFAQKKNETKQPATIKWYSFEEALALSKQFPKKKILVDVYTEWCGWCKRMDATTFTNPVIIDYINQKYYAVKLDAERKDTIILDGKMFINPNPTANRSTHQIAQSLLNNQMSYPSYVFLDEMGRVITISPGYSEAANFETILHYFGDNDYFNMTWENYQKQFKGKVVKE